MLLGLLPPDAGSASIFGRPPHDAVAAGAIGAMLQTGAVIRDVTVRELIAMMAALYPHSLAVDEVIHLVGIACWVARRDVCRAPRRRRCAALLRLRCSDSGAAR